MFNVKAYIFWCDDREGCDASTEVISTRGAEFNWCPACGHRMSLIEVQEVAERGA
jgi:hypothetical protein